MNHTTHLLCAFSLLVLCAAPAGGGMVLTCDPDAGTLSTGGAYASSVTWNGVQITAGAIAADGVREYLVYGDLTVGADDTVTAVLKGTTAAQHPVRFIVGNNAYLGGTFDFSASGRQHRVGGGRGGNPGTGGAGGTVYDNYGGGGGGGRGYPIGGSGGGGGGKNSSGGNGSSGRYGTDGHLGSDGKVGRAAAGASAGGGGGDAFGTPGSGGAPPSGGGGGGPGVEPAVSRRVLDA